MRQPRMTVLRYINDLTRHESTPRTTTAFGWIGRLTSGAGKVTVRWTGSRGREVPFSYRSPAMARGLAHMFDRSPSLAVWRGLLGRDQTLSLNELHRQRQRCVANGPSQPEPAKPIWGTHPP